MGLFRTSKEKLERLRGLRNEELPALSDNRLIMLALATLFEAHGIEDVPLMDELYRRGRGFPMNRR